MAHNGQRAIDMFEQSMIQPRSCGCHEPYRIIFMDSQMPVVDGYSSTRGIRKLMDDARIPLSEV